MYANGGAAQHRPAGITARSVDDEQQVQKFEADEYGRFYDHKSNNKSPSGVGSGLGAIGEPRAQRQR